MIFIGELFKIEGRPFRAGAPPGSILGAKMEPKWRPGAYKIHKEFDAEIDPKIHRFFIDFGTHVGAQNGTKMVPKSMKNRTKKCTDFCIDFWTDLNMKRVSRGACRFPGVLQLSEPGPRGGVGEGLT